MLFTTAGAKSILPRFYLSRNLFATSQKGMAAGD